MRRMYFYTTQLGSTCSGKRSNTVWYADWRRTPCERMIASFFRSYLDRNRTALCTNRMASESTVSMMYITFGWMTVGNMGSDECDSCIYYSDTDLSDWNGCVFWWTSNSCMIRKSTVTPSICSWRELCRCCYATVLM